MKPPAVTPASTAAELPSTVRIGTRSSDLALTQTNLVATALKSLGARVEIVKVHTQGDVDPASLAQLGGVGVFAAALRLALLAHECDLAVHSFKDLPTAAVAGLTLAAVPVRADHADVVVCRDGLDLWSLPPGARVGTGSARRAAAVLATRPDLQVVDIRGNVATRLGRVRGLEKECERGGSGDLDAVVLARAGLARLGSRWADCAELPALPAPAQGALAIEARATSTALLRFLAHLNDPPSRVCALAERAVLAGLQAGCAAPVGALASYVDGQLHLRGQVFATDGSAQIWEEIILPLSLPSSPTADFTTADTTANEIGQQLARRLLAAGSGHLTDLQATRSAHERTQRWGEGGPEVHDPVRPLLGRTVFIPRPSADHLVRTVEAAGARVLAHPLTETELVPDPTAGGINPVTAALAEFSRGSYSWVFITSPRTVTALAAHAAGSPYSDQVDQEPLADLIRQATAAGTRFAVLGEANATRLRQLGAQVPVVVSGRASGAHLAQEFLARDTSARCQYYGRAWLPASALASDTVSDALRAAGWVVDTCPVYTTVPVRTVPPSLRTAWSHALVEAVIFTAGSNARAASALLGKLPATTKVVTFGEPSARVARACGFPVTTIAIEQTGAGLVRALQHALAT